MPNQPTAPILYFQSDSTLQSGTLLHDQRDLTASPQLLRHCAVGSRYLGHTCPRAPIYGRAQLYLVSKKRRQARTKLKRKGTDCGAVL